MKTSWTYILLSLTLLISAPSSAQEIKEFKCWAFLSNSQSNQHQRTDLKQASYDPLYYEGDLDRFSVGADTYFLSELGVGLIIYDNSTGRVATGTVGFRKIPGTDIRIADIHYYDPQPDGTRDIVQLACSIRL